MLKRIATFLFGVALVSLGILFFIAPERAILVQILLQYWPVFLVLAGMVRFGGHLLDRQPRSPMGGLLLTALGCVLLAANLRGQTRVLEIIGRYWFWVLLAIVAGRVLRQYTHRPADGPRPRAFSVMAMAIMALVSVTGLGAHWLSRHSENLARLRLPFRLNSVRAIFETEYSIADDSAKAFAMTASSRLVFDGLEGDLDIHTVEGSSAVARIVKRIRASSEEDAQVIAQKITLAIGSQGDQRTFSISADDVKADYLVTLTIELPKGAAAGIVANSVSGKLALSGLKGDHSLQDVESVSISDNQGSVSIEGAANIRLDRIRGKVTLARTTRLAELTDISGAVVLNISGGSATLERVSGPVEIEGRSARIDLRDFALREDSKPAAPTTIDLKNLTDSKVTLTRLHGHVRVDAARTSIDASEITGDMSVNSSAGRVKIAGLRGKLRLSVDDGSVDAVDLDGPAEIEATREIVVRNFQNTLTASSRLGAISLVLDHQVAANVRAVSEHGPVRVTLPEDSRFRLDASTSFGRVRLRGFDDLNLPRQQRTTSLSYGSDPATPLLNLRSTNGDIIISASGTAVARGQGRAAN